MASYRGKFQYLSPGGTPQQGGCQIEFDDEKFTLVPDSGAPFVFDLGDVDAVKTADYEIQLPLYSGDTIRLQQFGKSYENLSRELLECHRKRVLACLLLEDLQEVDRFTGVFTLKGEAGASGPAEFRLFKSNLAVLPDAAPAFQWRLADIGALSFDSQNYEVVLEADGQQLKLSRLAKRTELFHTRLREAMDALQAESGQALHAILPFLNAGQLRSATMVLREGHSAAIAKLAAINPRIPEALAANAVDQSLKPYYNHLLGLTAKGLSFAGFKLIRPEDRDLLTAAADEESAGEPDGVFVVDSSTEATPGTEAAPAALYWFFFPIATKPGSSEPANIVAWEAGSRSGRATYFFRLLDPSEAAQLHDPGKEAVVEKAVGRINRVLGELNFRRRPIYLSDQDLESNAAFHRYAIAARRIPDLRQVRANFLGRALHSSFEAWQGQVRAILAKGGL